MGRCITRCSKPAHLICCKVKHCFTTLILCVKQLYSELVLSSKLMLRIHSWIPVSFILNYAMCFWPSSTNGIFWYQEQYSFRISCMVIFYADTNLEYFISFCIVTRTLQFLRFPMYILPMDRTLHTEQSTVNPSYHIPKPTENI